MHYSKESFIIVLIIRESFIIVLIILLGKLFTLFFIRLKSDKINNDLIMPRTRNLETDSRIRYYFLPKRRPIQLAPDLHEYHLTQ